MGVFNQNIFNSSVFSTNSIPVINLIGGHFYPEKEYRKYLEKITEITEFKTVSKKQIKTIKKIAKKQNIAIPQVKEIAQHNQKVYDIEPFIEKIREIQLNLEFKLNEMKRIKNEEELAIVLLMTA